MRRRWQARKWYWAALGLFVMALIAVLTLSHEPGLFESPALVVKSSVERSESKDMSDTQDIAILPITEGLEDQIDDGLEGRAPASLEFEASDDLGTICRQDWSSIAQVDGLALENSLLDRRQILSSLCRDRMLSEIKSDLVQAFVQECQDEVTSFTLEEVEAYCIPLLPPFRSFVIRQLRNDAKDLDRYEVPDLTNQLLGGFVDLSHASLHDLDQNIRISDALVKKDVGFYIAYKGKLLSLIMKELKFNERVDPDTYEDLYQQLTQFGFTNSEDHIVNQAQILRGLPPTALSELSGLDYDLVHIPFLRLSALGAYEELAQMAQEYIEAFPHSYVGYMYLAEAAWNIDAKPAAVVIFNGALGATVSDGVALEVLKQLQMVSPLDRLAQMKLDE